MAKPNYSFAKRQREIAKKEKKEAKRKLKAEAQQAQDDLPKDDNILGSSKLKGSE